MTVQSLKKRVGSLPPAVWMIAVMLVFYGANTKNYFTASNFISILVQAAPLFVVACGQTIIVLMQGTDLSLGASLNMMTVVWVVLMQKNLPAERAQALLDRLGARRPTTAPAATD